MCRHLWDIQGCGGVNRVLPPKPRPTQHLSMWLYLGRVFVGVIVKLKWGHLMGEGWSGGC